MIAAIIALGILVGLVLCAAGPLAALAEQIDARD